MPKWANSATLDTVAYSIDQQRLLREKMKKEEQEQKKKEERKKSENKYPGKRKGKNETTTSHEDAKRLKKLEKAEGTPAHVFCSHSISCFPKFPLAWFY